MRNWYHTSYKNKLYTLFVMACIVPLLLLIVFDYFYIYKSTIKSIEEYTLSNLEIASKLIDSDLATFTGIVNSIALNEEVTEIIKDDTVVSKKNFQETQRLYSITQIAMAGLPEKVPIHIINRYHKSRYSTTNYYLPYYIDTRGNLYDYMDQEAYSGKVSYHVHWRVDGEDTQDICYVMGRAIVEPDTQEIVGYAVLDIFNTYFQNIFAVIASQKSDNILVLDKKGVIITDMAGKYSTGFTFDSQGKMNILDKEGSFDITINRKEYTAYYKSATTSQVKVIEFIPKSYAVKSTLLNIRAHILLFAALLILGILFIKRNVRSIVTPVKQLDSAMQMVKGGDYTVNVSIAGKDEISRLGISFNEMIKRTDTLIHENYEKQIALQKAEMKLLKAQINPHFLYNCLNSISMMVLLEKNEDAIKMISALSRYYRNRVNTDTELVTIEDEVAQINNYLEIQKLRYRDKLEITIEIDDEVHNKTIPKLILLPLIENAFVHGIEQKTGNGMIAIAIKEWNCGLKILISDNGNGFGESKKSGENTGLANTKSRLQYYYQDNYSFTVRREEPFTIVELIIGGRDDV